MLCVDVKVMDALGAPVCAFDAFGKMVNVFSGATDAGNYSGDVAGRHNPILYGCQKKVRYEL
jgi:hypothetical protein